MIWALILDLVELIMSLEEEFSNSTTKIEIPDEDAEKSSPSRTPSTTSPTWVSKTRSQKRRD